MLYIRYRRHALGHFLFLASIELNWCQRLEKDNKIFGELYNPLLVPMTHYQSHPLSAD